MTAPSGSAGILRQVRLWCVALALMVGGGLRAADALPPAPRDHFNDYAGVVSTATARRLNAELAQFERDTSNQIVVAIYRELPARAEVADYAVRTAQAWAVGTKEKKNGAVLFFFMQSHDIRIVTGYGLEGVLPDALCKRIIENEIVPRFRSGEFDAGVSAGARAMMAAAKGEYRGTGRTVRENRGSGSGGAGFGALFVFLIIAAVINSIVRGRRNTFYSPRGRRGVWVQPPWGGGGGWGGGSSGGGGTFSGGGGSFGGGGAGGKW